MNPPKDRSELARDALALRLAREHPMLVRRYQVQRSEAKTPPQVLRRRPPGQEGDSRPTTVQRDQCVRALAL